MVDNDIQVLGNFPLSPRIRTLLLARNRVSSIQPTLVNSIPLLTNLQLEGNDIKELADLDPLGSFSRLTHLVLKDNPVTKKEVSHIHSTLGEARLLTGLQNYRYWVLWRCAAVRFIDYQKVKQAERDTAIELFGTAAEPTDLAKTIMGTKSSATFDVASSTNGSTGGLSSRMSRIKLTDKEKKRLQDMIKNATSLDEITKLETMLKEGRMPAGVHVGDDMEE